MPTSPASYILDVSTGSTVTYPCDYRRLTLSKDVAQLSITTGRITHAAQSSCFWRDSPRERLLEFLMSFVKQRIKNDMIASVGANALLIHAEGNENDSEDASNVLSTLQFGKAFVSSSMKAKIWSTACRGICWRQSSPAL